MFQLEKNELISESYCKYRDEYGNTAIVKRMMNGKEGSISARLRFADKRIKAEPFQIQFPLLLDNKGQNLNLKYHDKSLLQKKDVAEGISNFVHLVNYWITMNQDICLMEADNSLFLNANEWMTNEDVSKYKLSLLTPYAELKPVLQTVSK